MDNQHSDSLEQLVFELFTTHQLLQRVKDDVGIVTQWGIGAWMILQFLSEEGDTTEAVIAKHQHISQHYTHELLQGLLSEGLVECEGDKVGISRNGEHSLGRLRDVLQSSISGIADHFSHDQLHHAIVVVQKLRHLLT